MVCEVLYIYLAKDEKKHDKKIENLLNDKTLE